MVHEDSLTFTGTGWQNHHIFRTHNTPNIASILCDVDSISHNNSELYVMCFFFFQLLRDLSSNSQMFPLLGSKIYKVDCKRILQLWLKISSEQFLPLMKWTHSEPTAEQLINSEISDELCILKPFQHWRRSAHVRSLKWGKYVWLFVSSLAYAFYFNCLQAVLGTRVNKPYGK